jgi:hypothetical protein
MSIFCAFVIIDKAAMPLRLERENFLFRAEIGERRSSCLMRLNHASLEYFRLHLKYSGKGHYFAPDALCTEVRRRLIRLLLRPVEVGAIETVSGPEVGHTVAG